MKALKQDGIINFQHAQGHCLEKQQPGQTKENSQGVEQLQKSFYINAVV